jgi:O-antigen/teichoic acid export membrane protein
VSSPVDPASAESTPKPRAGRVSRDATLAFLAQMVGAALTAVITVFLGRALSPTQFGYFTFALSVITIGSLFADLGITTSAGRFLAERRDDPAASASVFRTTLRLKLQIGVPAAVALFLFAGPLCDAFGTHGAIWAVRGCAIVLLAQSIFGLFLAAYIALGTLRYNVYLSAIESVTEAVATFALVLLSAVAASAAFGRAIGFVVASIAGAVVATRTVGSLRGRRARDHEVVAPRRILGYAGPLLLVEAAFRAFASIDVLLIAAIIGGGAQIAAFGLPMRLAVFLEFPSAAVASAVAPRLARRRAEDTALLAQSLRYLIIFQILLTAPLLVWPEAIIHLLFGGGYVHAPAVLRGLAPYVFLGGLANLTTLTVNYIGLARRRVPIAVVMLAVNVLIDVILLPRIGVVAGAIGSSAAYLIWVPAHAWILRREIGLSFDGLLLTLARCCLAGAVLVGVLALLGTGVLSLPVMLAGAVAGTAAYVFALLALGELRGADLSIARRVITRRVPI